MKRETYNHTKKYNYYKAQAWVNLRFIKKRIKIGNGLILNGR